VAGAFDDAEVGIGDRRLQPMRPVGDLPAVLGAPDQLDRQRPPFAQPIGDLERVPRIIVPDLVLEQACLADRPRDVVQVGVQRAALFEGIGIGRGRCQPVAKMAAMGGVGRLDQLVEALRDLLAGPARG
jgi:hypothetical protein